MLKVFALLGTFVSRNCFLANKHFINKGSFYLKKNIAAMETYRSLLYHLKSN